MKVLFVCKGNIARSQMAEAVYNDLTHSKDAESAGTRAYYCLPGETLEQYSKRIGGSYAVEVMNELGYDINHKHSTQLTKDMLDTFDVVISMAAKRFTPKWLSNSPKYVYWKITDPGGLSRAVTVKNLNQVKEKVQEFLQNK